MPRQFHVLVIASPIAARRAPPSGCAAGADASDHVAEFVGGLRAFGLRCSVVRPRSPAAAEPTAGADRPGGCAPCGRAGEPDALSPGQVARWGDEVRACAAHLIERSGARPDVLHVYDPWMAAAAFDLGHRWSVPVVVSLRALEAPLRALAAGAQVDAAAERLVRTLCQSSSPLIVTSEPLAAALRARAGPAGASVYVVRDGFDTSAFLASTDARGSAAARGEFGVDGRRLVAVAADPHRPGDVAALLESARAVTRRCHDVVYAFAVVPPVGGGSGGGDAWFEAGAGARLEQDRALAPRVRFFAALSRPRLARLYAISEFAVTPPGCEARPRVAVEQMAAALPVVAARAPRLSEIVGDGEGGLLVPPGHDAPSRPLNPDAFAEAQLRLLHDPIFASRLGARGRHRAATLFTRRAMAHATLTVYQTAGGWAAP